MDKLDIGSIANSETPSMPLKVTDTLDWFKSIGLVQGSRTHTELTKALSGYFAINHPSQPSTGVNLSSIQLNAFVNRKVKIANLFVDLDEIWQSKPNVDSDLRTKVSAFLENAFTLNCTDGDGKNVPVVRADANRDNVLRELRKFRDAILDFGDFFDTRPGMQGALIVGLDTLEDVLSKSLPKPDELIDTLSKETPFARLYNNGLLHLKVNDAVRTSEAIENHMGEGAGGDKAEVLLNVCDTLIIPYGVKSLSDLTLHKTQPQQFGVCHAASLDVVLDEFDRPVLQLDIEVSAGKSLQTLEDDIMRMLEFVSELNRESNEPFASVEASYFGLSTQQIYGIEGKIRDIPFLEPTTL